MAAGANVSISVILPVHNEEKRLEIGAKKLLSYCAGKGWDFELIFVQDDSSDNTASIMERIKFLDNRVKILNMPVRLGKGGAIISAILNLPMKEYVAYMDIDLSAEPSELERLFEHIKDYDVVIGSRILHKDLVLIKRPYYRSILSHLYSRLFRVLFRIPILDPQCGLKLFRSEIVRNLFQSIMIPDFAFDSDLIVTAYSQNLRIKEVPINWAHYSSSKVQAIHEIGPMATDILSIWYRFHQLWQQHKATYPQKRGSTYGRLFFVFLSSIDKIKKRDLEHAKIISLITNITK
jgi:glycosyltransferase involved in cell wall biosynthesis